MFRWHQEHCARLIFHMQVMQTWLLVFFEIEDLTYWKGRISLKNMASWGELPEIWKNLKKNDTAIPW